MTTTTVKATIKSNRVCVCVEDLCYTKIWLLPHAPTIMDETQRRQRRRTSGCLDAPRRACTSWCGRRIRCSRLCWPLVPARKRRNGWRTGRSRAGLFFSRIFSDRTNRIFYPICKKNICRRGIEFLFKFACKLYVTLVIRSQGLAYA